MKDITTDHAVEGRCRYCGEPRPKGYAITCGRSECQEAAYNDKERRNPNAVARTK